MNNKLFLLVLILFLVNCHLVFAVETGVLKEIKESSNDIEFSQLVGGFVKAKFSSMESELVYIDMNGQRQFLSKIKPFSVDSESYVILNMEGKVVKADFQTGESSVKRVLGTLDTEIPGNSRVTTENGNNFQVSLADGAIINEEPKFSDVHKTGESSVRFQGKEFELPSGKIINGAIEHDGYSYALSSQDSTMIGIKDSSGKVKYLNLTSIKPSDVKITGGQKNSMKTRLFFNGDGIDSGNYLQIDSGGRLSLSGGKDETYHRVDFPEQNMYTENPFSIYSGKEGMASIYSLAGKPTVTISNNAGIVNGIHTLYLENGKIKIDKFIENKNPSAELSIEFMNMVGVQSPVQVSGEDNQDKSSKPLYTIDWKSDNSFNFNYYSGEFNPEKFNEDGRVRLNPFPTEPKSTEYLVEASVMIRAGLGMGSGTIIGTFGDKAYVLTAAHVVREDPISPLIDKEVGYVRTPGSKNIPLSTITLSGSNAGEKLEGKLLAIDDRRDIALLEMQIPSGMKIASVPVGNEYEKEDSSWFFGLFGSKRSDEDVICIGCGQFNEPSVKTGKIDGYIVKSGARAMTYFTKSSAPTIKGDSGGGVFNKAKELIGVTSFGNEKNAGHTNVLEIRDFLDKYGFSKFHKLVLLFIVKYEFIFII